MLRILTARFGQEKHNKNSVLNKESHLTRRKNAPLATVFTLGVALFTLPNLPAVAAKKVTEIPLQYLRLVPEARPVLSNILPPPEDLGVAGAELAIADSNTTGRFLGQKYTLNSQRFENEADLLKAAESVIKKDALVLVDVPAPLMATLNKQAETRGALLFNVANPADELRASQCLNNTFHTYPSRSMLTDALAQWLAGRRFSQWFLIAGPTEGDQAYLAALKRSAKRFGGKIVDEKSWSFDTDLRRTAQKELPLFTQAEDYDVVLVADEEGDFGHYVPYNTWLPRPVAGTQGLTPVAWHRVVEQWGAAQLQSRFIKQQQRNMQSEDYAAWAAVRSVAEAVTQNRKDPKAYEASHIQQFLLSDQFHLAAFKGHKLTYRDWNGQLRQPIPLVQPRSLVSQSPQAGFLHPVTELDTLGFDRQESQCDMKASL